MSQFFQEPTLRAAIAIAWKAQMRLSARFRNRRARGLHKNKIVVAVAREHTDFVCAIAREIKPHSVEMRKR